MKAKRTVSDRESRSETADKIRRKRAWARREKQTELKYTLERAEAILNGLTTIAGQRTRSVQSVHHIVVLAYSAEDAVAEAFQLARELCDEAEHEESDG